MSPAEPVPLFPESNLHHSVSSISFDEEGWFIEVLILRFAGGYGIGSEGNPDAQLMIAVLGAALARCQPDAVVFDFLDLEYTWGDALLGVFQVFDSWSQDHPVGASIAAGDRSRLALRSLFGRASPSFLHASLDAAVAHAKAQGLERSRGIG